MQERPDENGKTREAAGRRLEGRQYAGLSQVERHGITHSHGLVLCYGVAYHYCEGSAHPGFEDRAQRRQDRSQACLAIAQFDCRQTPWAEVQPVKYNLYCGKDGRTVVRFDNETGKGDHRHVGPQEIEEAYCFTSLAHLLSDFETDIIRLSGDIT